MDISIPTIKSIFNTLPTGYYLGRRIVSVLDDNSIDSYYDPGNDKIVVSLSTIERTCEKANLEEDNVEEVIRGLIYHELSHVILSGKISTKVANDYDRFKNNFDIINTIEDERIETIFKDYYMNTNFKKNIVLINGWDGAPANDVFESFYNLVRFHSGAPEWVEKVKNLIVKYSYLNPDSEYYSWKHYFDDILDLYNDYKLYFENLPKKKIEVNSTITTSTENEYSNMNYTQNDEDEEKYAKNTESEESDEVDDEDPISIEDNSTDENDPINEDEEEVEEVEDDVEDDDQEEIENFDIPENEELITNALTNFIDKYEDASMENNLRRLIDMANAKKGMFEGSRRGYAGKVNPKLCGREDYQWFVRHNHGGSITGMSKIHFNLFIDSSSSMSSNEVEVNKLLRAISRIKSSTFDFDVITIDDRIEEWDHMKEYKAHGGTRLSNAIAPVIRNHQIPGCSNYNIVVFDGVAHRKCLKAEEPFRHFDTPNSILVVDSDNERFVSRIKQAKVVVIDSNYVDKFIDEVFNLLAKIL